MIREYSKMIDSLRILINVSLMWDWRKGDLVHIYAEVRLDDTVKVYNVYKITPIA